MTIRKLSDEEQKELSELLESGKAYEMLKAQSDINTKTLTIEALFKDNNLLAVTSDFDDIDNFVVVEVLLNILIADARQCTDIEDFIKTIISIWGTYDETEGNS